MKGSLQCFVFSVLCLATIALSSNTLQAQCLSGNCQNGIGSFRFTNGDEYAGEWMGGKPHGNGTYKFNTKERYEGNFNQGKFEGQGTMYYPNNSYYQGSWIANKKHGNGIWVTADQKKVRGTWNLGQMVASTTEVITAPSYSTQSGTSQSIVTNSSTDGGPTTPAYTSPIIRVNTLDPAQPNKARSKTDIAGLRQCNKTFCTNGTGYFDYPDGSRWIGEFKEGYPSGKGTCFYSNGDRYEGQWSNNAPNGEGIMHFHTGRVHGAVWLAGSPIRELDSDEIMPSDPVRLEPSSNVKIWAIVIGVGKYSAMPTLKFTDDDAYRFYSFLKSPEGGALPESQIELLVDETATRENILRAMRNKFLKADENDVVVLYFSGHGLDGCFLPVDYDGYKNKLRHEEVKRVLAQSKAKHKLCIADACYSGSMQFRDGLAAKGPASVTLQRFYQAFEDSDGGVALLMSSQQEELSLEDHGLRQGIFTYYLLQGLKGKADNNGDKLVTIAELYRYVYKNVREYTDGMQTPIITGSYDDAMPVSIQR